MNFAVYIAAVLFAITVFPLHVYNYIYVNTGEKYASLNAGVYGINFFNMNTVKDSLREMQINGKNKKTKIVEPTKFFYRVFNQLCLYKVVQLGDFGTQNQNNVYVAFAQNSATTLAYKLIQVNGNYCKLRNYTVFNEEHGEIRYYAKVVTVVNILVILKILLIIMMEKRYERKTQKK